jgi:hypothetical protein
VSLSPSSRLLGVVIDAVTPAPLPNAIVTIGSTEIDPRADDDLIDRVTSHYRFELLLAAG